jgi:transposase-like protein
MGTQQGGRPPIYSPELTAEICARIADGQSIRKICRDESMPAMPTIFFWLREYPEFLEQYNVAKESQADALAEDLLEIADMPPQINEKGGVDSGDVAHMRLRIDTRKWIASKLKPKKYGDKIEQEIKGDMSLTVQLVRFGEGE